MTNRGPEMNSNEIVKVKPCGEGTREYPNRTFQVMIEVGVQSFAVGPRQTKERADWFASQLMIALDIFKHDVRPLTEASKA